MRRILIAVGVLAALALPASAHAYVTQKWSSPTPDCWQFSVTNHRGGVLHLNDLWRLNETVHWCTDLPPVTTVWEGPVVHRSHWENITWNWSGYESRTGRKLLHPTRWIYYVRAEFTGNGEYLVTPHDHPWVRITIWKRNPSHVAFSTGCGC